MDSDSFKPAWQAQASPHPASVDAALVLKEVQRNEQKLRAELFRRDMREVGVGLLMVPVWIYMGIKLALPWTWYLTVPVLVWIAGFILADRLRHNRRRPEPDASLKQHVESTLGQIEHQIWLLRNVFWWYLLPPAVSVLVFVGHSAWRDRAGGVAAILALAIIVVMGAVVFAAIHRLNQHAVRKEFEPRRQELEALLASLSEESAGAT